MASSEMNGGEQLLQERLEGGVELLTLNRPEVLNALSLKLLDEFSRVIPSYEEDDSVRAIVLTGAGRAFCSGEDLRIASNSSGGEFARFIEILQAFTQRFLALPIPTIAAVNGPAIGGGCELALACDLRIASEDASFGLPEVDLGLLVTGGTLELLGQIVGRGRATELLFTGRTIDAEEARSIGLVTEVIPNGEFPARALERARSFAEVPREGLMQLKQALAGLQAPAIGRAMEAETVAIAHLFETESAKRRVQAFVDRPRERQR